MAKGSAEAGATVVLNGSNAGRLAEAASAMRATGYSVHESRFDVTDENAVEAAFTGLDEAEIAVDILVNNAGIQFQNRCWNSQPIGIG